MRADASYAGHANAGAPGTRVRTELRFTNASPGPFPRSVRPDPAPGSSTRTFRGRDERHRAPLCSGTPRDGNAAVGDRDGLRAVARVAQPRRSRRCRLGVSGSRRRSVSASAGRTPAAQFDWPPAQHQEPAFEDLYGRAVAIVRRDRKASSDHLRGCLHIGYMRASDLIERMEKEGIVGAPLYNGVRPILIGGPGSDEI